jgi:hypothetical protein
LKPILFKDYLIKIGFKLISTHLKKVDDEIKANEKIMMVLTK